MHYMGQALHLQLLGALPSISQPCLMTSTAMCNAISRLSMDTLHTLHVTVVTVEVQGLSIKDIKALGILRISMPATYAHMACSGMVMVAGFALPDALCIEAMRSG
jgi:hypothetical protein